MHTFNSVIPLLEIYALKIFMNVHKDLCTKMCIPALFITAKIENNLYLSTIKRWLNKLWYIHMIRNDAVI